MFRVGVCAPKCSSKIISVIQLRCWLGYWTHQNVSNGRLQEHEAEAKSTPTRTGDMHKFAAWSLWLLIFKKTVTGTISWPLGPTRKLFFACGKKDTTLMYINRYRRATCSEATEGFVMLPLLGVTILERAASQPLRNSETSRLNREVRARCEYFSCKHWSSGMRHWKLGQYVPPKRWYLLVSPHCVTTTEESF